LNLAIHSNAAIIAAVGTIIVATTDLDPLLVPDRVASIKDAGGLSRRRAGYGAGGSGQQSLPENRKPGSRHRRDALCRTKIVNSRRSHRCLRYPRLPAAERSDRNRTTPSPSSWWIFIGARQRLLHALDRRKIEARAARLPMMNGGDHGRAAGRDSWRRGSVKLFSAPPSIRNAPQSAFRGSGGKE